MRRAAQLLAVLCVVALLATSALAGGKKPPKPPDDDPSTGGGTIYFTWAEQTWSMDSDGNGKTPLAPGTLGEPSRQLHDGQRWFLETREADPSQGAYPDGLPLREFFAVSEDGLTAVQLTSEDPASGELLQPLESWLAAGGRRRWNFADTKVSWTARLWRFDDEGETWYVDEDAAGIYALDVSFASGAPEPVGLPTLLVSSALVYVEWEPDWVPGDYPEIGGHAWSPDGNSIVCDHFNAGVYSGPIYLVDLSTGVSQYLTDGYDPEWSPDGTTIAFVTKTYTIPPGGVETIKVDGSDRKMVFSDTEGRQNGVQAEWHYFPSWSPTGSHLSCYRQTYHTLLSIYCGDVLRAQADGRRQSNLTRDLNTDKLDAYAGLLGWR